MPETIYTIPINEAFDKCAASENPICPFCRLEKDLENNELDLILGASMMEPDVRIKTNKSGFCPDHFSKMMTRGKRLPLALILESHLNGVFEEITKKEAPINADKAVKRINELNGSCYVCDRMSYYYTRIMSNAAYMWKLDDGFRPKLRAQKCICMKHFADFASAASRELSKKEFPDFYSDLGEVFASYFKDLRGDVSWFCKKFDYRYQDEPWYNAKDSVERAVAFLSGSFPEEKG